MTSMSTSKEDERSSDYVENNALCQNFDESFHTSLILNHLQEDCEMSMLAVSVFAYGT
jgi:hypothetical protein